MLLFEQTSMGYGEKEILRSPDTLCLDRFPNGSGITVIRGRNASGKSTLLRSLAGLLPIIGGAIHLNGRELTKAVHQRKVRYLAEPLNFPGACRAREILHCFSSDRHRIIRLISLFSLNADQAWHKLSLGQKQRLRIILALLQIEQVELMLLDEPFLGLDDEGIECAKDVICEQLKGQPVQFLIALHQQEMFRRWYDRELRCENGNIRVAESDRVSPCGAGAN